MVRYSNDKLLLTDTQVSRICIAFANGSSVNKTFSKTQLSKIAQLEVLIYAFLNCVKRPFKIVLDVKNNDFVKTT